MSVHVDSSFRAGRTGITQASASRASPYSPSSCRRRARRRCSLARMTLMLTLLLWMLLLVPSTRLRLAVAPCAAFPLHAVKPSRYPSSSRQSFRSSAVATINGGKGTLIFGLGDADVDYRHTGHRAASAYFITALASTANAREKLSADMDHGHHSREDARQEALRLLRTNAMPGVDCEFEADVDNHVHDGEDENRTAFDDPASEYDNDNTSPVGTEFLGMMGKFSAYTSTQIRSVPSARYRALFLGVAAGAEEKEVLRSFLVLFEDYLPIRFGGRFIFRHLNKVMERATARREEEMQRAMEATGWDGETVDKGRNVFDMLLEDEEEDNGDENAGWIAVDRIVNVGTTGEVVETTPVIDKAQFVSLMREAAAEENGKTGKGNDYVNYVAFMKGLRRCASVISEANGDLSDATDSMFRFVENELLSRDADRSRTLVPHGEGVNVPRQRKQNAERFNLYVATFTKWENKFLATPNDGLNHNARDKAGKNAKEDEQHDRRIDILRGCFVGARNERVVAALKIVYMDYRALRVAGDLIFKLMSKIVG